MVANWSNERQLGCCPLSPSTLTQTAQNVYQWGGTLWEISKTAGRKISDWAAQPSSGNWLCLEPNKTALIRDQSTSSVLYQASPSRNIVCRHDVVSCVILMMPPPPTLHPEWSRFAEMYDVLSDRNRDDSLFFFLLQQLNPR